MPEVANVCVATRLVEVEPSPKAQRYLRVCPSGQLDRVDEPVKVTEAPLRALAGTVAAQLTTHPVVGATVMVPVRVHVTLPIDVVSVQVKVPADA